MNQQEQVQAWFNALAPTYKQRFGNQKPWHAAVFKRRIDLALAATPWQNKRILDIGAGTGLLFEAFQDASNNTEYWACDIAEGMKKESRMPPDRYKIGTAQALDWPIQFDVVYLLGVSTYMTQAEIVSLFNWLSTQGLAQNGVVVATFTHHAALDNRWRRLLQKLLGGFKSGTLGQTFSISSFTPATILKLLDGAWSMATPVWFNVSITPLQHIFPTAMARLNQKNSIPPFLAADFMVVFKVRE